MMKTNAHSLAQLETEFISSISISDTTINHKFNQLMSQPFHN